MKKVKSQNEKLLNALQNGRSVTNQSAFTRFGICRLSARIYDLRENGHKVKTNYLTRQGARVASYSL